MNNQKVTLSCGIAVDFTGKLDEPFNFIGTFADIDSTNTKRAKIMRYGIVL